MTTTQCDSISESFDRAVTNSSGEFDYYRNNIARLNTASQVSSERQVRPAALNYSPVDELVVVPAPGAVMLFSGAQLHASIPNTSGRARFSVDFRTVDVAELCLGRGAPLVDVRVHRHRHSGLPQGRGRRLVRRGHCDPAVRSTSPRIHTGVRAARQGGAPCLTGTMSDHLA